MAAKPGLSPFGVTSALPLPSDEPISTNGLRQKTCNAVEASHLLAHGGSRGLVDARATLRDWSGSPSLLLFAAPLLERMAHDQRHLRKVKRMVSGMMPQTLKATQKSVGEITPDDFVEHGQERGRRCPSGR